MRHLKKLCAACVLTLVIAISAFAGNMETMIVSPPPPPPSAATQGNMEAGSAGNMETTGSSTATDAVTGIVLSLFQSLLALV
jgi:hypothetical protein